MSRDPLAGYRRAINAREITTLIWPAALPCPVNKGEMYELQSCVIEIEQPSRKLVKGRPAEWHVKFVRHEVDRVNLLRASPPMRAPSADDAHLDLSDTERARREGQYTTSRYAAMPDEPESVGPDWEDKRRGERELRRNEDRRAVDKEAIARDGLRTLKARSAQTILALGAKGYDVTPCLNDIYERLAQEEREMRDAA
jgi:hypothetical protein